MVKIMEKKVKTLIYVAADGSKLVNPAASVLPATTDMVITSYTDDSLVIDAPIVGEVSTEPQRQTVNELVADWLGKRKMKISSAKGDFRIREEVRKEDGDEIPSLIIKAPDGRPTDEQLHVVVGKAIKWLNATGVKPEAKTEPKPEPKKDDGKKSTPAPAPKPDPKNDDGQKSTPAPAPDPKQDDGKKSAPAPAPKPEPKKDDGKKSAPAPDPKPAAPTYATKWDPKKSIEENLDAIMGPAD
ncbi:MAG: hypothetical protein Q4D22_03625 [Candidatus Saccharibacteria bacterium]|nr:hypothetical protein [Candidatus Saccharibacteria bacterium]